jgi:hypothetical protein
LNFYIKYSTYKERAGDVWWYFSVKEFTKKKKIK